MTRKRLKKLMMARGLSRNQANRILGNRRLKPRKVSNKLFWIVFRHEFDKFVDACGTGVIRYFWDFEIR
ncbi:MAG TPA: hypothetical protein DGV70_02975 [Faecalibacterium sp.]|nr:hypothetical protein [Faecalibacterium sp.]